MLDRAGITLQDFAIYEIHEAFAAQVLCTLKAWESADYCRDKLKRDAPLGAIDRSQAQSARRQRRARPSRSPRPVRASLPRWRSSSRERGSGRGLISICTAGGMGVAAILER